MDKSNTLDILKNAFIIEKKGMSLYQKAMENAKDNDVKAFFKDMVADEQEHMHIIEKQFKAYTKEGHFLPGEYGENPSSETAIDILNKNLKEKISGAGFEATAITASIALEQRAVDLYSKRAESATDPEEKKMYKWLAAWETTHLKKLHKIDQMLTEEIWLDKSFWPF